MTQVISISNQKGGVGKTMIAGTQAHNLADRGYKVLAIDNDSQGSMTSYLAKESEIKLLEYNIDQEVTTGINNSALLFEDDSKVEPFEVKKNLHVIGANKKIASVQGDTIELLDNYFFNVDRLKPKYDFVIIDCPPAPGLLQQSAHVASDFVLAPVNYGKFAIEGLEEQARSIRQLQKRLNKKLKLIGIVVNDRVNRSAKQGQSQVEQLYAPVLEEKYGDLVFKTKLTRYTHVQHAIELGESLQEFAPKSNASTESQALTDEILERALVPEVEV